MKPNLIIIGAMKAGTTSLHEYLQTHPDISMSEPKELNFFSNPKYWNRGEHWYEKHFRNHSKIRGESSTSYTRYPIGPDVPKRMHSMVPEAKLIYLLRDPIDRFLSHYVHKVSDGTERRTLSEVVEDARDNASNEYVCQSRYYCQLVRFLDYYPKTQIMVITTDELGRDLKLTLDKIREFLGLSSQFQVADENRKKNVSANVQLKRNAWVDLVYPSWMQRHPAMPWVLKSPFFHLARLGTRSLRKPELSDEDGKFLRSLFDPELRQLESLTERTYSWSAP